MTSLIMPAYPPPPSEVPSPCVGVCALDPQQVCTGCGRTLAEIAEWSAAPRDRKLDIRRRAEARLKENKR